VVVCNAAVHICSTCNDAMMHTQLVRTTLANCLLTTRLGLAR
jgi:hypothetical protein